MVRTSSITLAAALAVAVAARFAHAQQAPVPAGGIIAGVVIDSIRGGYLRGAVVGVSGAPRSAFTDSAGRFRIDDVAPGLRQLQVVHPLLDSVGIVVTTTPQMVRPRDTVWVVIALPSAATLIARKCSAAERARGPAALMGTVTDADSEAASVGAEISVAWTDYALGASTIDRAPQQRVARVDSTGAFVVCGLPDDLITGVAARRGFDSTAAVLVDFSQMLAVLQLRLPPPSTSRSEGSGGQSWPGAVRGIVTTTEGQPVGGARVAIEEDSAVMVTRANGSFSLAGLRPGTRLLTVRRLGFEPVELAVDVRSDQQRDVTVKLANMVPVLATVQVTALRELGLARVGYTTRKGLGTGTFFDPDDIARRNSPRLNEILEHAGPLRIRRTNRGLPYVVGRDGGCVTYHIDGMRWSRVDADDPMTSPNNYLSGAEIAAVEIYSPHLAPPEFMGFSRTSRPCSVVVVWTKNKLRMR